MSKGIVLVTGCTEGGIGSALAECFQSRGFTVYATLRDVSKIGSLADKPNIIPVRLDVTKSDELLNVVNRITTDHKRLDYLINNAATAHYTPILDEDADAMKRIFDANFFGPVAIIKAFASLLIESRGTIVNIGSCATCVNMPWTGTYAASKSAFQTLSEVLRIELEPFGVRVRCIMTGAVKSNAHSNYTDVNLPTDSLYKPLQDDILSRAKGEDGYARMPTHKYANNVVEEICQSSTNGKSFHGGSATLLKYLTWLAPQSVIDYLSKKDSGLEKLSGKNAFQAI